MEINKSKAVTCSECYDTNTSIRIYLHSKLTLFLCKYCAKEFFDKLKAVLD